MYRSLTDAQIRSILAYGRTKTRTELAQLFGVSASTISNILSQRRWSHVQP